MRSTLTLGLALALALALALVAPHALAQGNAENEAAGRALFAEGRRLMQEGKLTAACAKFEEGQRIDPGIGMKYNLAECYEKSGKIASAWSAYLDVAGMSRAANQLDREKAARDKAAALESRVSRMKIIVPTPARVDGLSVLRDGAPTGTAQWEVSIPIDAGRHVLAVSAPGRIKTEVTVDIVEGSEKSVEIPLLALAPVAPAPVIQPAPLTPPPAEPDPGKGKVQRIIGIGVGVIGLAGIGVGATFGLLAKSKKNDADAHCFDGDQCDVDGLVLRDAAIDRAHVSTGAFIAGGVLLAGGIVLFLTAPRGSTRTGFDAHGVVVRF